MIITCPACRRRFGVGDQLIPDQGRRARCASCGEVFQVKRSSVVCQEGDEIHFQQIRMPGDGLATGSTFVAPAAPMSVIAGRSPVGDIAPPARDSLPPLFAPTAPAGPTGASSSSKTPAVPAQVIQLGHPPSIPLETPATLAKGPASHAAPAGACWRFRDEAGRESLCDKQEIVRLIKDGVVNEGDPLAAEGAEMWKAAGEFAELVYYFRLRRNGATAAAIGAASRRRAAALAPAYLVCENHPGQPASYGCGKCGASFCDQCVRQTRYGQAIVQLCLRCQEPCMRVVQPRCVPPFWHDLGQVLRYPVSRGGLVTITGYTLLGYIGALSLPIGALLYFLLLMYQMLIVKDSARGRSHVPYWPDFSSWFEVAQAGLRGVAVLAVSVAPLVAFNFVMLKSMGGLTAVLSNPSPRQITATLGLSFLFGNLVLLVFVLVYYPMAFGITSVFDTIMPVLNPLIVLRSIGRIKLEYAAILLFFIVTGLVSMTVNFMLRLTGIPFIGLVESFFAAYVIFAQMHVLGWTLYQTEDRLSWDVAI